MGRVVELATTLVLLALLLPLIVYSAPFLVGGNDAYVVLSGSMEPTLSPGDIVVTGEVEPGMVGQGDVVTFERNGDFVTHRVVEVRGSGREFVTKGDANEERDRRTVGAGQLEGRMLFSIPFYGRVISYAGRGIVPLILILVPAAFLIGMEVRGLLRRGGGGGR